MCYTNTKYFWWTSLRSLQLSDLMYVPMFRTTDRYWYMLFIDIHDVYHWSSLRLKRIISSLFTCSICIHPYCLSIISSVYHHMQKLCTSMAFFSMIVGDIRISYLPTSPHHLFVYCFEFRLVSPLHLVIQRTSPKPICTCSYMLI